MDRKESGSGSGEEATVSLCLITRDEAENLPRCLASVAGVVNETIVVDTGSTDGTVEVASQHGARVERIEWPGDFSQARNVSLDLATGDWLLVMDADEELDHRDRGRLRALVADSTRNGGPEGFLLRVINHLSPDDETPPEIHASLRLFRNRPGHRYSGTIHEQPQVGHPARTDLRIHHWGYLPDVYAGRRKAERNEALLLRALSTKPDDPYLLYSLAVLYYSTGRPEQARLTAAKAISRIDPTRHYHHRAVKLLAMAEQRCGNAERALEVLDWGLSIHAGFTDLLYLRARLRQEMGDLRGAVDDVCQCLVQGDAPIVYDGHAGLGGRLAVDLLATLIGSYPHRREKVLMTLLRVTERAASSGDRDLAERAYNVGFEDMRSSAARLKGRARTVAALLLARYIRFLRDQALTELRSGIAAAPWCEALSSRDGDLLAPAATLPQALPPASPQALPPASRQALPPASSPPFLHPTSEAAAARPDPSLRHGSAPGGARNLSLEAAGTDREAASPTAGAPAAPSPTLALCMIVKDEAVDIARSLASVAPYVDEIIVVDTGSTDTTRETATEFGATIIEFPWNGDFSQARNAGLDRASADWILILDADEEFAPGHGPLLRELIAGNPETEGFFLRVVDYLGDYPGIDQAANISFRLFRNRPEHRYRRAIHEQVTPVAVERDGKPTVKVSSLVIRHYGYLNPVDRAKKRGRRNMALAMKEASSLDDPFSHFNLGSEYLKAGRLSEALEHYREAVGKADRGLVYAVEARIRSAVTLALLGAYQDALAELAEAERSHPYYTDVHFLKGELLRATGRLVEARTAFERCLELGEAPIEYPTLLGVGSYRAATYLAHILSDMGSQRAALTAYARALASEPRYLPAFLGRARAWLKLVGEEARLTLEAEAMPDGRTTPLMDLILGYAWLSALRPDWALPYLVRAKTALQQLPLEEAGTALTQAKALAGLACFALGKDDEAILHLREAGAEGPAGALVMALLASSRVDEARAVATGLPGGVKASLLSALVSEFERITAGGKGGSDSGRSETADIPPGLPALYFQTPQTYIETAVEIVSLAATRRHRELLAASLPLMKPVDILAPWVRLGLHYHKVGLLTMAVLELGDCLRRGVVDAEAAASLGECLLAKGRTHDAERAFRQALEWSSATWRAWLGVSNCLLERARTVAREALNLFPGDEALGRIAEDLLRFELPAGPAGEPQPRALPGKPHEEEEGRLHGQPRGGGLLQA